jgi:SsrA-binding protein
MKKNVDSELVSNRKAFHDYEIFDTYEAGIVLQGSEVKSLKNHSASLQDAYVTDEKNELWLINSSISPYKQANVFNHEERRKRKLLLHQSEIAKIQKAIAEKGMTVIPLSFFLKKGFVKVKIAIAKGKKTYDKRAALKEKEHKRSMQKALRSQETF